MIVQQILLTIIAVPVLITERRFARIPDWVPLSLMLAAGALAFAGGLPAISVPLSAALGLGIPLLARVVVPDGLGWGDVKLSLALFLLLGPVYGVVGLLLACGIALGGVALAAALERFSVAPDAGLPFGPSMVGGAIVALTMEIPI